MNGKIVDRFYNKVIKEGRSFIAPEECLNCPI